MESSHSAYDLSMSWQCTSIWVSMYLYIYIWESPRYCNVTPPSTDSALWSKSSAIQCTYTSCICNLLIMRLTEVCIGSVQAYGYSCTYVWNSPHYRNVTPPSTNLATSEKLRFFWRRVYINTSMYMQSTHNVYDLGMSWQCASI